jgi:hypothetical protein
VVRKQGSVCVSARRGANAFSSFLGGGNEWKCRKRGNSATGRHSFRLFAQVQRNKFMEIYSGIRNSALT